MRACAGPLVLLAACNAAFGLETTHLDVDDDDGDGVLNEHDNCPSVANPLQSDLDGDGFGDACDDCPLVPDAQGADHDGDGIGDACDPHPLATGDCLLLLESFGDPSVFDAGWDVIGARPVVAPGMVQITGGVTAAEGIVARDPIDAQVVEVSGTTAVKGSYVAASLVAGTPYPLFGCRLADIDGCSGGLGVQPVYDDGGAAPVSSCGLLSADHVGDDFVLRLRLAPGLSELLTIDCRGDYGLAAAARTTGFPAAVPPTRPGVVAFRATATITGVAAYGVATGPTCPPPLVR